MTKTKICGIQLPADALAAAAAGADYIGLVFVPNRRRRLAVDAAAAIVSALRSNPQLASQLASQVDQPADLPTGRPAEPQSVGQAAPVRRPRVVGLFADQPLEEVNRVIRACGLDAVQLCGQESPEYCRQVQVQALGQVSDQASNMASNQVSTRITGEAPGQVPGQVPVEVIKVLHVPGTAAGEAPENKARAVADLEERLRSYRAAGCRITLDKLVEGFQGGTGQSFDWEIAAQMAQNGYEFLLAGGLTPDNVAQAVAQARPWGVDVSSGVETDGNKDPEKMLAFIQNVRSGGFPGSASPETGVQSTDRP